MASIVPDNQFDAQPPKGTGIVGGVINSVANAAPANAATAQFNPTAGMTQQTYTPQTREVNASKETTQGQLASILSSDNPLMQRARTIATQQMAQRGLVNSSMNAEAGTAAMIDRAAPIAGADAQTYDLRARTNMDATNSAGQFNVGQNNQLLSQGMTIAAQMNAQKDQQRFAAGESNLDRGQQTSLQTGQQAFAAAQSELQRAQEVALADKSVEAQTALQLAQQRFAEAQAGLDREQQTNLQTGQQEFVAGQAQQDRTQQTSLVQVQQAFTAAQSELDRALQVSQTDRSLEAQRALQDAQQRFTGAQAELDRVQQTHIAGLEVEAQRQLQTAQQQFVALQANLDREQQTMLTELQAALDANTTSRAFAANTAASTLAAIHTTMADPDLKPEAKRAAINNIITAGNSTMRWASSFYNTPLPDIVAPSASATGAIVDRVTDGARDVVRPPSRDLSDRASFLATEGAQTGVDAKGNPLLPTYDSYRQLGRL